MKERLTEQEINDFLKDLTIDSGKRGDRQQVANLEGSQADEVPKKPPVTNKYTVDFLD